MLSARIRRHDNASATRPPLPGPPLSPPRAGPDHGRRPALPVAALARLWVGGLAFFLSFFLLLSALPLYARQAGLSDLAIGLVIGAFAVASMLVRPVAGWAADRFGRRPLLAAGAGLFVVAPALYAASAGAAALVAVRLLHGAGMGLYPTAASAAVADLAPAQRRGEVLGLFGVSVSLALAVGPVAGTAIAGRLGFPALFAVATATAIVALLLSRTVAETLPEPQPGPFRAGRAFSVAALPPSALTLVTMLTWGVLVAFLPLHAAARGLDAGVFFLAFALAVAASRPLAGRLSDRFGRPPLTAAGLALAAVALGSLAALRGTLGLLVGGVLYGLGLGAAQSALLAWCADVATPADRGRAMGTFYTALELGIAVGSVGAGFAVGIAGVPLTLAGVAALAAGAAALAPLLARTVHERRS